VAGSSIDARYHTSGTPVTNFQRNTRLYKLVMSYTEDSSATRTGSPFGAALLRTLFGPIAAGTAPSNSRS
jgi:hypothetical protein